MKFVELFVTILILTLLKIHKSVTLTGYEDVITIYMSSKCQGPKYYLSVDRGRCIDLPAWISVRESQMSINPEGYCLKMFETNQCKTSILRGTKKPVEFIGCRNPKQIGLQSFKSFIIVPC